MFIRPCYRFKNGKCHAYWALVESYRTSGGPRQRIVSYLGQTEVPVRSGIHQIELLKQDHRRYILGTPKAMLRQFEAELLSDDWQTVHEGLEVQCCPGPDGDETFILCRSEDRRKKEQAMHERFEKRIEEGLQKIQASCVRQKRDAVTIATRVGRLLGQNSRAAGLFKTDVKTDASGLAKLVWHKVDTWRNWATLSEGCYMLRTNIKDWSGQDLWQAYIVCFRQARKK